MRCRVIDEVKFGTYFTYYVLIGWCIYATKFIKAYLSLADKIILESLNLIFKQNVQFV